MMTRLLRGLARAATLVATILLWTWATTKTTVTLIGATTVVDDFNQFVERLPAILNWLFSTPWWVPAGLATTLTIFLIWLSWPAPRVETPRVDRLPPPPKESEAANKTPYLEKTFIHPDPINGPTYCGIPLRKGQDAKLFAEYQRYDTATHKWSPRRRILIAEDESFSVGPFDAVKVPLLSRGEDSQWRWNSLRPSERENFDPQHFYQGRVTFIGPEGLSEDCWFKSRPGDLPLLEDNNSVFGFIPEWKARDERQPKTGVHHGRIERPFPAEDTGLIEWNFDGLFGSHEANGIKYISKFWIQGIHRQNAHIQIERAQIISELTGKNLEMKIRTDQGYVLPQETNPIPPLASIYLDGLLYDPEKDPAPQGLPLHEFMNQWGAFKFAVAYRVDRGDKQEYFRPFDQEWVRSKLTTTHPLPSPRVTKRT
jgi:hypothetical protein